MSRETLRSATSMPSLRSSPWILGAPHRGFAAAISLTRAVISALTGGRPPVGRPESWVQCSRKRRRCHRRTVAGVTITRDCRHPAQTLASPTQKRRSVVRSLGRGFVLLYTASCWRKARFSRASWRWPPQRNGRTRSSWSKKVIIEPRFSPDQRRQINRLAAGRGFGEGQPWEGLRTEIDSHPSVAIDLAPEKIGELFAEAELANGTCGSADEVLEEFIGGAMSKARP